MRAALVGRRVRLGRDGALGVSDATVDPLEAAGAKDAARLSMLAWALSAFGLVIVLSASSVVSIADYGSPWSLFERQVLWTALGGISFLFCRRADLPRLRRFAVPGVVVAAVLLLVVLAPGIGKSAGGSSRWIGAGPFRLQPSELAKLAFAVFAADLAARRRDVKQQWAELVRPLVLVCGFLGLLIMRQPDMGTAIVLVTITAAVLYGAGVERRILLGVVGALGFVGSVLALSAPYRRARLLSFVNPFAHPLTTGYQVVQGLITVGSGHLTGTGLGRSVATWGFLPNAETDFIFAVIANELGLLGAALVLAAFLGIGWIGVRVAARTLDPFASLLALAMTCWIVCQAFINVGGVLGMLPETGIPLPFLSSGGSSLVVALGAVGLLVNIARCPRARLEVAARTRNVPARSRSISAGTRNNRARARGIPARNRSVPARNRSVAARNRSVPSGAGRR